MTAGLSDLLANGVYARFFKGRGSCNDRPALFVDRDGVIIEDDGYISAAQDVRLIEGSAKAISCLNSAGIPVVVVTNQSGIGRGYFGWQEFIAVQERILEGLAKEGASVDAVLACPFHESGKGEYRAVDHPYRKPNPGMLLHAAEYLSINLSSSWMVGDKACDVEAAMRADIAGALHVLSGQGREQRKEVESLRLGDCELLLADDLEGAVGLVIKRLGA